MGYVFGVLVVAGAAIVSGRVRLDVVALLVVLALVLGGALSAPEALAGFGDPVVLLVAGLLVLSDMLARTGVARAIGDRLARWGRGGELRLLVLLSLVVAALGGFMSNSAVVAVFLPVVTSLAGRTSLNAQRLLLPLAYAALVSGMLTLIATPPNLVVSEELRRAGFGSLGFFALTPIGAAVWVVFVLYMAAVGRRLLPGEPTAPPKTAARSLKDLLVEFDLLGAARRLQVPAGSPLVGRTLEASELGSRYDVRVIVLERPGRLGTTVLATPSPKLELRAGDVLVVHGTPEAAERATEELGLRPLPVTDVHRVRWTRETGIAKVLVHPDSRLVGSTLRGIGLRSTHGVHVLAVRRRSEVLPDVLDQRLQSGDAMLVVGPWKRLQQLRSDLHDFVVLDLPAESEQVAPAWRRAPVAVAILALLVVLSAFEVVPVVVAVLVCALLAVLTRCLTMDQAYAAVHWSTVVLIAGMLSLARAMVDTGAIDLVVTHLVGALGGAGPYVMLSALFALTAGLSMVLSNTATAVLLAPVALRAAESLDVAPQAFATTVAIAASAGFVVPVASPAVMLVVGPGGYRTADFVKAGTPLLVLTWLVTLALAPLLFPFEP